MSATGLDVFDITLHKTNAWLGEICQELQPDRQTAWHALGAVLRAVRDRIPVDLAAHLGAQLPLLVRGTYYDQYTPAIQPLDYRHGDQFLEAVTQHMPIGKPVDSAKAVHAVFGVLTRHIDPEQADKVRKALPEDVRDMWPDVMPRPQ